MCAELAKIFDDAYKSPISIVVLDNIERLDEYIAQSSRVLLFVSANYFGSRACQAAHWPPHKHACKFAPPARALAPRNLNCVNPPKVLRVKEDLL